MTERRYDEAEVAAIFERATEAQQQTGQRSMPSGEGMTLSELQAIGREVGLAPEMVARAAMAVDRTHQSTTRTFVGLPIGVGRVVDLNRKLSDEDWDRLVVDLRDTFDARGVVRQEGSLRQWRNGNLQAVLEPTATGHRIDLRTLNANARGMMLGGIGMMGLATVALINTAFVRYPGSLADIGSWASFGTLASIGLAMFGIGALRVPGWAKRRREQMETIAARLVTGDDSKS